MKSNRITAAALLAISLFCAITAAKEFRDMWKEEPIARGPGVAEVRKLSDYFPKLKGTIGDTDIFVLNGSKPGGSILVLAGTHANEPAGLVAAVLLIENAKLESGRMFVVPRANRSALTHNDPQEGSPQRFTIKTPWGARWFRYGSRATNPVVQWPDPDVYIHASSGQRLSGNETRNLNRSYPGRPDGNFTEQVAFGITELIRQEKIDLTIDLHESSPEYPVINAVVAHERAMPLASEVIISLQLEGIPFSLEPSPRNLSGLSHRELGDYTDTLAVLMETANPSQGRLRGKTDESLVLTGIDHSYEQAVKLGRLFVSFDETGHPLEQRVGRHLAGVLEFARAFSKIYQDKPIIISNVPGYDELQKNGIGRYLLPVKQ